MTGATFKTIVAERLKEDAASGLTRKDVAAKYGVSLGTIHEYAHRFGIHFPRPGKELDPNDRDWEIRSLFVDQNKSMADIGNIFGISRERVRQILKRRFGLTYQDGGIASEVEDRRKARCEEANRKCLGRHGCTREQFKSAPRAAYLAFRDQVGNARRRDIAWELKFWQWWLLWQESGKWSERSRTGYNLTRIDTKGPFSLENSVVESFSSLMSRIHSGPRDVSSEVAQ